MKLLKLLPLFLFLSSSLMAQPEITSRLRNRLESLKEGESLPVILLLKGQSDMNRRARELDLSRATAAERIYTVITELQSVSKRSQAAILQTLENAKQSGRAGDYLPLWIANAIALRAEKSLIESLSGRLDIDQIDLDNTVYLEETGSAVLSESNAAGVEPGVKIIKSDKLWKMGITGAGRLVMNIDNGVDGNHPALSSRWRGNRVPHNQAWHDLTYGTVFPADSSSPTSLGYGHGTHTMGTLLGLSRVSGDTLGVAFDAEWIASNAISGGNPHTSRTIAALQWGLDPDGNPATSGDVPDVINCSWYDGSEQINYCESNNIYRRTLDALEAAGIAVVFSAGNKGANTGTISNPQNINTDLVNTFCVANMRSDYYLQGNNDPIYFQSSRGPSSCGGTGSLLIKPEVAAPGYDVRSAMPGNKYGTMTGTSMASPHVAGAIALLKQLFPNKTGRELKLALYNSAIDLGTPGEDNTYGKGLIDVFAALKYLNPEDNVPPSKITDLKAKTVTSHAVTIEWNAPADTTIMGVRQYDIRYSHNPIITMNDFMGAKKLPFSSLPAKPGVKESLMLDNITSNTKLYFAVRSADIWENWSDLSNLLDATTLGAPQPAFSADSIVRTIVIGTPVQDSVIFRNVSSSPSTLDYSVYLEGNSFPVDMPGFSPEDSASYNYYLSTLNPAVTFRWNDISLSGQEVTNWTQNGIYDALDEGYAGPFNLGFDFDFYTKKFNQVYLSSNGFISFDVPDFISNNNVAISNTARPNSLIAPFWDDMFGRAPGKVYVKAVKDTFIVQYTNWSRYSQASGSITFQAVLTQRGKIFFYYKTVPNTVNQATTGIENSLGTHGLNMSYNTGFVKNNMAVEVVRVPDWITLSPKQGTVFNGNSQAVRISYNMNEMTPGDYSTVLKVTDRYNSGTVYSRIPVRIKAEKPSSVKETAGKPVEYGMSQNYPNPFNPSTVISYQMPEGGIVSLRVFDILGREVKALVRQYQPSGRYSVTFNGSDLPSGIYIFRLDVNNFSVTRKMTLIK